MALSVLWLPEEDDWICVTISYFNIIAIHIAFTITLLPCGAPIQNTEMACLYRWVCTLTGFYTICSWRETLSCQSENVYRSWSGEVLLYFTSMVTFFTYFTLKLVTRLTPGFFFFKCTEITNVQCVYWSNTTIFIGRL